MPSRIQVAKCLMTIKTKSDSPSQPAPLGERGFVVLFLVLLTGAFVNLFISPEQILEPGEGMPGMRYMWAVMYLITLVLWLRHCKGSLRLLLQERTMLFLVAFAIVSVVWSDSPETTLRRGIALVGTSLMALYFAARFKFREQLQLLVWTFGICIVFSFLFGWLHWGHSVDDIEGAWYGIYTQRNSLGSMMVFGALLFLIWARVRHADKWIAWLLAAMSFVLILLSGSKTSLVAFSILLLSIPMVRLIRTFEKAGSVILVVAVLLLGLGWWVGTSFDAVTEAMGRDSSLTGRTELWGASILIGIERPWLGYGYNAFWLGLEGQSADVWQIVGWPAPSAHNGLLEIWLDLGLVGLAAAVFSFGASVRKAFHLIRETTGWESAWPLLFLVVLFLMNLTESVFFEGNSIYWFLYMVIALDLCRIGRQVTTRQPMPVST